MTLWQTTQEQSVPERPHHVRRTHAGAVLAELHPVGMTLTVDISEGSYSVGGSLC